MSAGKIPFTTRHGRPSLATVWTFCKGCPDSPTHVHPARMYGTQWTLSWVHVSRGTRVALAEGPDLTAMCPIVAETVTLLDSTSEWHLGCCCRAYKVSPCNEAADFAAYPAWWHLTMQSAHQGRAAALQEVTLGRVQEQPFSLHCEI